ncbi:hypothetical protein LZ31DRAFT_292392 [Colletotrichum somersetense]|nr:hypothetical protein LZ31DRAFT_292392 [Colletotrichum somersetense]
MPSLATPQLVQIPRPFQHPSRGVAPGQNLGFAITRPSLYRLIPARTHGICSLEGQVLDFTPSCNPGYARSRVSTRHPHDPLNLGVPGITTKRYLAPENSKSVDGVYLPSLRPGIATPPSHVIHDRLVCGPSSSSRFAGHWSLSFSLLQALPNLMRARGQSLRINPKCTPSKPAPHDVRYPRGATRLWSQSARDAGDLVLHVTQRSTPRPAAVTDAVQEENRIITSPTSRRLHENYALQARKPTPQVVVCLPFCNSATLQPPFVLLRLPSMQLETAASQERLNRFSVRPHPALRRGGETSARRRTNQHHDSPPHTTSRPTDQPT